MSHFTKINNKLKLFVVFLFSVISFHMELISTISTSILYDNQYKLIVQFSLDPNLISFFNQPLPTLSNSRQCLNSPRVTIFVPTSAGFYSVGTFSILISPWVIFSLMKCTLFQHVLSCHGIPGSCISELHFDCQNKLLKSF